MKTSQIFFTMADVEPPLVVAGSRCEVLDIGGGVKAKCKGVALIEFDHGRKKAWQWAYVAIINGVSVLRYDGEIRNRQRKST